MNIEKLEAVIADSKAVLKDGLIAVDIFERKNGLSLAGLNSQPVAVALFTQVMEYLESTLQESAFPPLDKYFLMDLKDGHLIAVINHGDLLQGMMVNSRVNLGVLLSVVIPKAIKGVADARI